MDNYMRSFSSVRIFLFMSICFLTVHAEGIVKGYVLDSLKGEPLNGVSIVLSGTTFNAISNISGEFDITGIPEGEYILKTSCLGYLEKKILVSINSNAILRIKLELIHKAFDVDSSFMKDIVQYQIEKINLQNNSKVIKNAIIGKELYNLPDENFVAAFSRLPGISVLYNILPYPIITSGWSMHSSEDDPAYKFPPQNSFPINEAFEPKVLIRGLDSKYGNFTIDGISIPSTSARDRSVDYGLFTDGNFRNIELNKTITSDRDADATAGIIDIVTGKAPDKLNINARASGNKNQLDNSLDQYNYVGSFSNRFFNKLFGIQADFNIGKEILSNEQVSKSFSFSNLIPSYTNSKRERINANVILDFDTPDGGSIKLNNYFSETNSNYFKNQSDSGFGLHPEFTFSNQEIEKRLLFSSLSGHNFILGLVVDWNLAFSESRRDRPFDYTLDFMYSPLGNRGTFLAYSIDNTTKGYSRQNSASFNLSKKYVVNNKITGELKVGAKLRMFSRYHNEDLRIETGSVKGKHKLRLLADSTLVEKDFSGTRFDSLVGESMTNVLISYFQDDSISERTIFGDFTTTMISKNALSLWRHLNYSEYYLNDGLAINSYDLSENIYAGYLMHQLNFEQSVRFITGLRIESEKYRAHGYYFPEILNEPIELFNNIPQKSDTYEYDKVSLLPNFQMILKPTNFLNIHLAAYKTLLRPDYDIRQPKYFSVATNEHYYVSMGNPFLEDADVWNYEFQTKFYGGNFGLFSINAYYKEIDGMPTATNGIALSDSAQIEKLGINFKPYEDDFPIKFDGQYKFYSFYNSRQPTRIWGFEIEHLVNFNFLPGLLKNIILNYNFTFTRSETWEWDSRTVYTTTAESVLFEKKQKLFSVPEFVANIILGYDIMGFSFRISYRYQDKYYLLDLLDTSHYMAEKYSKLDIALKQQLFNHFSIFLNLNNITDFDEKYIIKDNSSDSFNTIQRYRYGFNFDFGIGVKF